jgi:NitT/TauT family transport system substrate-binding protein
VVQGYPTNTFYEARKQNIDLNYFSYASAGFNPYGQILVTTDDYAAKNGATLTRALGALSKGWHAYLTNVDAATKANDQMLTQNDQLAADTNWFTWAGQRPFVIGSRGGQQMGAMADDRWVTTIDQMKQMGALPADWTPNGPLYDNKFLPADTMPRLAGLPAASRPAPCPVRTAQRETCEHRGREEGGRTDLVNWWRRVCVRVAVRLLCRTGSRPRSVRSPR